ncbi:NAD(P)-binding protein [Coniophora puteana RWD-64-598 SS2]|uniref:NAD(P)-binding protein n=1 Tax=Coniophora puteana (strain RWD-64-598) TaxID=741705 RepID=A0A5M3MP45_CONPW|nr:NAD(P)-binding protein [Coniophora puteana RWD-64-598 SS2]EIW80515.1 NAD(P)-binding protein [Coniophora puteana RWD-64-598 SS2]
MGNFISFVSELFPPAVTYSSDDMPDMAGKVILITGANVGIGKEIARILLLKNAKVYIAARDKSKAELAIDDLKASTGKEAYFIQLDLSNLRKVKAAVEEYMSKETELHVLFNNGGVLNPPIERLTDDGCDLTFGTNVLGHYYLTTLLLPILLSTAKASPERHVRVIHTSSNSHHLSGINFDALNDTPTRKKLSTETLYSQSKSGNIVFSNELARRYGDQGIVSISVHPGKLPLANKIAVRSYLQRLHLLVMLNLIKDWFLSPVTKGALTPLYAATSPEGAVLGGQYLIPWARVGRSRTDTRDPVVGARLWQWLEEQVRDV